MTNYSLAKCVAQVKDVTRNNCKGIVAASLDEVKIKVAEKFGQTDIPNIHLDSDGTEIDDEDYFQTLEPNTELVAVFTGEQWIDVSKQYIFVLLLHLQSTIFKKAVMLIFSTH